MSFLFSKISYLILTQLAESTADGSSIFLPFSALPEGSLVPPLLSAQEKAKEN